MKKDVLVLVGAGQIGMAIARCMGERQSLVIGDKRLENAEAIAETMNNAGFDACRLKWIYQTTTQSFQSLPRLRCMAGLPCL